MKAGSSGDDPNATEREFWSGDPGGSWVELADPLEVLFGPFGDVLLEHAAIEPGQRILDIGCGMGATTRRAAMLSGPEGHVTGLDISSTMLSGAARVPVPPGSAPIDWIEADAQTHDFGADRFDRVISRMGVMFFADPGAAFANLLHATAPGGRFTAICWRRGADALWFKLGAEAVAEVLGPPAPADPNAPGPMAFADGDRVTGLMRAAGWLDARVATVPVVLRPGGGIDGAMTMMTRFGPAGRAIREAGPDEETGKRIFAALRTRIEPYIEGDSVALPVVMNLFTARAGG
ncbi:methyltransferase domain-containing protein [Rhodobacterales bacterium HKCCE3408]|nr:methyltransferase domain-containing protein [Rhodobacterales bacterium HKCCE3408]